MIHGLDNLAPPMLRGSYAGGSLNVTARCPVRRSGPSANPAHPRPGSRPARDASRSRFGCRDSQSNAPAIHGFATPLRISATLCRRTAKPSRAFALTRGVSRRHAIAEHCLGSQGLSVAYAAVLCFSLALSRGATPSRDIAFQSRRPANLGGALPSPCLAVLRFAFARPCSAKQRLRCPYRSIAVARRGFASPSPRAASLRSAVAVPGSSWPSYPMPLRIGPLPVLRGSVRFLATPSPLRALLRSSFAALLQAALVLRRAKLSRAFPSRRRAKQISSFAALGLAGLLRRRAARRHALLFHRLPEQIKALPLQCPSPQRHRAARPSHANPLPPTSSRCRRISLKASPRCSVAPPHNATQIHRRTMPLMALPSRIIATLR